MIRKFSTTSFLMLRRFVKSPNPGLNNQINAIENAAEVIQSDPEGFGSLESDLLNAHESCKNHELELKRQSEKRRQYIIKNKYFRKDPMPNLLTYAEKEHIKFLHSSDEEEWTVEKLSESFPANVEIISKILKANWVPMSSKRIRSHDASVFKNWERFKSGEYKAIMTPEFYEHLKKFVDRKALDMKISQVSTIELPKKQWQKPISKEFLSIVSPLQSKTVDSKELNRLTGTDLKVKETGRHNADSGTHLLGEIKNKEPISIHQLKSQHMNQLTTEKHEYKSENEIHSNENNLTSSNVTHHYTEKFISNEVVISDFDRIRYGMSVTKQRICIPRKLWRKGATYRANDCYYDDDGEFLYKVPGMTSS